MNKIKLIGFFLILVLPILNLPPWFSPPDWGKTIVFRIILSILIFLFICQILFQKYNTFSTTVRNVLYGPKGGRWAFWLLIALSGVFFLATIFSLDPLYSFLGDPHRAGGFLNFGLYIVFAVLAFLILQKQDWQKIWDFSILIGILVSIIAVFQQYNILTGFLVHVEGRPFSTIGSSVLLAIYLILLVFITLSFLLKEKGFVKRLFYLSALLLFLYVILLTESRAAYFGLLIGFSYFIFAWQKSFFPLKRKGLLTVLKILFAVLLVVAAYGVYYVNSQPKFPDYLEKSETFQMISSRLSIGLASAEPRFSAWLISLEALKERPFLGYGPENFSIAFDKYYDPSLPFITKDWGSWWDRAHNFLFDISVTAGIPALIIFISLFAVLFWGLQRVKEKKPEDSLISHGIQATFLAYFATNLFSFDTFSSYLILFLMVGYSLSLTSDEVRPPLISGGRTSAKLKHKQIIMAVLFVCLIWFIWSLNLRPLMINKEANIALQLKDESCQLALAKMEENLSSHSFLDQYLGMKYAEIINSCIKKWPSKSAEMTQNITRVLKKNTEIRPTYARNWLYLGIYTNLLIEKGLSSVDEADYYFKKAHELSPKKQEILVEWAKTYFITDDYTKAKEKAQQCIGLNPVMGECWWLKGISNIYLGDMEEAELDLQIAKEKRYDIDSKLSLLQLAEVYLETKNYKELIEVHEKLIKLEPNNAQYYASLAYNYKIVGDYKKAKETAEKIIKNFPEMKTKVEEFLRTLR